MLLPIFSLLQKITAINPQVADFLSSRSSPSFSRKVGKARALMVFKTASETVPAYKKFLAKNGIDPALVESFDDFQSLVPLTDKSSYVEKYNLEDLCLGGKVGDKCVVERSSGYHGKPYYWPRFVGQDDGFPGYFEFLSYKNGWLAKDSPTLVLVCFGLGLWVGGMKMAWAYRQIGNKGRFPMTMMTPGVEVDETIKLIKDLGKHYERIFIAAYPPLAKAIIEKGIKEGINWKKYNVVLLVGGEGHSESWRDYMASLLGFKVEGKNLNRIVSVYGSADIGAGGGYETPLSIIVRRFAQTDADLAFDLFGSANQIPQLFQYSPASSLLEIVNNEFIYTSMGGIPVVRYNMHDKGGIIYYKDLIKIVESHGYNLKKIMLDNGFSERDILPLDFNYVFGRSDGTATLYGANIYVENIKEALSAKSLAQFATGNFKLRTKYTKKHDQYLSLEIELKGEARETKRLKDVFTAEVVKSLARQNSEYKKLYETQGEKVKPRIKLVKEMKNVGVKNVYT